MHIMYDLENDMKESPEIVKLLGDPDIAKLFYGTLTNTGWRKKIVYPVGEEGTFERLKTQMYDQLSWCASFRYVAGFIAEIRCLHYNVTEDYMDFYCSSSEGCIDPFVAEELEKIGWLGHPDW